MAAVSALPPTRLAARCRVSMSLPSCAIWARLAAMASVISLNGCSPSPAGRVHGPRIPTRGSQIKCNASTSSCRRRRVEQPRVRAMARSRRSRDTGGVLLGRMLVGCCLVAPWWSARAYAVRGASVWATAGTGPNDTTATTTATARNDARPRWLIWPRLVTRAASSGMCNVPAGSAPLYTRHPFRAARFFAARCFAPPRRPCTPRGDDHLDLDALLPTGAAIRRLVSAERPGSNPRQPRVHRSLVECTCPRARGTNSRARSL